MRSIPARGHRRPSSRVRPISDVRLDRQKADIWDASLRQRHKRCQARPGTGSLVIDVVCVSDDIAPRLRVLKYPLQAHEEPDEVVVVSEFAFVGLLTPLGEIVVAQ